MNPTSPSSSSPNPLNSAADEASAKASGSIEAAREKLQEAGHVAHEKMELVSQKAGEAVHAAREKIEGAGTSLLQWARENPATALATFFASGFVIGAVLAMQRHEKTFGERFHDDPGSALRDAVYAALLPLRDRVQGAAESARSIAEDVVDRVRLPHKGHSWTSRWRNLWN